MPCKMAQNSEADFWLLTTLLVWLQLIKTKIGRLIFIFTLHL